MDPALRSTPLLDLFKRNEVTREVRVLAAQGALAARAHEQLALLVLLAADPDAEIAAVAEATLARIPADALSAFLARSETPAEMRRFFAERGIDAADAAAGPGDAPLIDIEDDGPRPGVRPQDGDTGDEDDEGTALQRLASMTVPQRLKRAMKGTREERAILIRDPNRIVAAAVLSSPKMSETEVASIARMANVSDDILRTIAHNRAWMKNYAVVCALARNPKTPVAISMNLLGRLSEKDLRQISTDRNVPDTLRLTARKKIVLEK
jgi:hypothetical protein